MKRLLLTTSILGTFYFFAGVLHGSCRTRHEKSASFSLNKVYSNHYPEALPSVTLIPVMYSSHVV